MKNRVLMLVAFLAVAVLVVAGVLSLRPVQAQLGTQAQAQKQLEFEKTLPKLNIVEEFLPLTIPGHTLGETEGITKDSKGNMYVYSRTGWSGTARAGNSAKGFMFDAQGKFVKELMPDGYGQSFAHSIRADKYDNIWVVDEGSGMIMKLNQQGNVIMTLGRKTESIDYLERFLERGEKLSEAQRRPVGNPYTFNRPTDIAWDGQDNFYISDVTGTRVSPSRARMAWTSRQWAPMVPARSSSAPCTRFPPMRRTSMLATVATGASRCTTPT